MIPTTLTGILLLLVLLLPGFVFVTLRERHQPARRLSVFRETSVVLAATTASYAIPAVVAGILVGCWPEFRSQVATGLSDPGMYASHHAFRVTGVTLIWVVVGTGIGAALGTRRFAPLLTGTSGGSAWWELFEPNPRLVTGDFSTEVTATLDDGAVITGRLYSWNRDADDGPDREFTLQPPLWLQAKEEPEPAELDAAAMTISARVVRHLSVRYIVDDEQAQPDDTNHAPSA